MRLSQREFVVHFQIRRWIQRPQLCQQTFPIMHKGLCRIKFHLTVNGKIQLLACSIFPGISISHYLNCNVSLVHIHINIIISVMIYFSINTWVYDMIKFATRKNGLTGKAWRAQMPYVSFYKDWIFCNYAYLTINCIFLSKFLLVFQQSLVIFLGNKRSYFT